MKAKWLLSIAVVAVAGASIAWFATRDSTRALVVAAGPQEIPVATGTATLQDVPIMETGLGTVQAFNTVTVRPQVNGQITRIAFTEGQDVKAGELLALIDPRPFQALLEQAKAQLAKDQAQLKAAKLDLERYQSLAQRNFGTRQSVDVQIATVAQLEAAIMGDQAAIDTANINLGYASITAPISGRTGMRLVDMGNVVHTTDQNGIVVITQIQPITVVFTLPEEYLPEINRQQAKSPLKVDIWQENNNVKLDEGVLSLIDNQIDQSTGSIRLKATLPNANHRLWPGQFVTAHLVIEVRHDAVTVPAQTIQRGPNGTYVWLVKPDSTVDMQPVKVGQVAGNTALVLSGLQGGERVVTDGQYKLRRGVKVVATGQKAAAGQANVVASGASPDAAEAPGTAR